MKYPKLPDGPHPVGEAKVRFMQTLDAPYLSASAPGWSATKSGDFSRVNVDKVDPVQPPHEPPDGWYSISAWPMLKIKGSSHPRKRFKDRGTASVGEWVAYSLSPSGRGWAWQASNDGDENYSLHRLYRGGRTSKPVEGGVFRSLPGATSSEIFNSGLLVSEPFMYFGHPAIILTTYHPNGSGAFEGIEVGPYRENCLVPAVTVAYIADGAAQFLDLTLPTETNRLYSRAHASILSPTRILVWYSEADVTTGDVAGNLGITSYRVGPPKAFLFTLRPDGNLLREPIDFTDLYPDIANEWVRYDDAKQNFHAPLSLYRFTEIEPLTAKRVLVHTTYQVGDWKPDYAAVVVKEFVFDVTTGATTEVADLTDWLNDTADNPFGPDTPWNPLDFYYSDYLWSLVLGEGSWLRTKYLSGAGFKVTGYGASEGAITWRSGPCEVVGCRTQAKPGGYRIYYVNRPPGRFNAKGATTPGTAERVLYEAANDLAELNGLHPLTEAAQHEDDYISVTWVGTPQSPAPCDSKLPFRTDARFTMPDWYKDGLDL